MKTMNLLLVNQDGNIICPVTSDIVDGSAQFLYSDTFIIDNYKANKKTKKARKRQRLASRLLRK